MTGGKESQQENAAEDPKSEQPPGYKPQSSSSSSEPELDDFGLPRRPASVSRPPEPDDSGDESDTFHDAEAPTDTNTIAEKDDKDNVCEETKLNGHTAEQEDQSKSQNPETGLSTASKEAEHGESQEAEDKSLKNEGSTRPDVALNIPKIKVPVASESGQDSATEKGTSPRNSQLSPVSAISKRVTRAHAPAVSEWSHQKQVTQDHPSDDEEEEEEWQAMPALDEFDIYDDNGRLVAKGNRETEEETNAYSGIGGAGKGYTRVQLDEDAQSATSMDEDTNYLFQNSQKSQTLDGEFPGDDEQRDALTQLQATKDLLTEGQRIAYVGVVRLTIHKMLQALSDLERTKATKREITKALESMDMWGQKMMVRLYTHMDINPAEQIMIEQLAEHGVQPSDLVTPLMLNAKVKNPLAHDVVPEPSRPDISRNRDSTVSNPSLKGDRPDLKEGKDGEEVPEVHGPEDMPHTKQIELDLRWTVLCDLFLVLISDGEYDARSRRLLERVGSTMNISWIQICRFEKKVIDQLEMQEAEAKENWDESENMEKRRKLGLKRKYMVMGLATVGGGLVIGLSAGLLAPFIGAGLATGFTTIGITGTAGFLGGVGGTALITSASTAAGGIIAVRASERRTGHVKTFEYRPLHNNKRFNLILTVSGWMAGKIDDVRLPYSTVDPIMGDIYSLLWEPEMLQSMGDTINILATEALTQTVQQVLGSTILVALMASLQLPIVLSKLAYLIDNPWSVSLDRANAAGLILADSLMDRHLGQRPITLLGFSLGSRVIFSCLKELSNRGAYGLVQNVYLFGSPVVAKKDEYLRARSVVSGRFLNGYASNDWILGYLFRATSGGIMRVAGLAPVEGIPGVENIDVSNLVSGHMAYRAAMPQLLRQVGWEVESDEFTEIEDPDPDNHAKRQRELIQEIDEARKKAEERPEKKRFGLFKSGKLAEKRGWETYSMNDSSHKRSDSSSQELAPSQDGNVLFDIDAIRKELEGEMIEVRELNSTLPPMQITSVKDGEKHVEYIRLPHDIKPDEIARMNLPPRPDEIDVGVGLVQLPPVRPARTSSLRPSSISSPHRSPRVSPQRSPQQSPDPNRRSPYAYSEPRELVTTLPPLSLTPSQPHWPESNKGSPNLRPDLKPHATDPSIPSWNGQTATSGNSAATPMPDLDLERNAWADDDDDFDQSRGGIKMTFE
ncbi:uncharacterized protein Z518_05174 [Rhinocladiella mackenziei CBS 650.93]|uniref:DUF726 domain protein n=1 Tax=Rhinocladiella mackenziei CBS 650.93 TaxID=1442369 RepID=A0A0D2FQ21_9EURO|nr:uncharacterized protein Z518_05174 [Rhinocladiella mackenziei CBS 650.93]KIX04307.1 hypothetical protein Z518_05174 [Rhinocladiella mackenziei CBS 650.93]